MVQTCRNLNVHVVNNLTQIYIETYINLLAYNKACRPINVHSISYKNCYKNMTAETLRYPSMFFLMFLFLFPSFSTYQNLSIGVPFTTVGLILRLLTKLR